MRYIILIGAVLASLVSMSNVEASSYPQCFPWVFVSEYISPLDSLPLALKNQEVCRATRLVELGY